MTTTATMKFQPLSLDLIRESSTNPRRTFDPAKLQELAESIRAQGLIQPIVVRPVNDDVFEIVAGARRYRAAKLAEVPEVPVGIVALSDEQALEWTLIENSLREDVHPYEEAHGYQQLLNMPGYDVAAIAAKTGKSESHLYARLKLLNLIEDVATAFREDRITATHAVLIARLPHDRQAEAFEQCWRTDYYRNEKQLQPAKALSEWLQTNVYRNLAEAPFDTDDATLMPEAGACPECPKQSGFNTRLFTDVLNDVCLDGKCWNAKLSLSLQRNMAERPELVQIANGWTPAKDRRPGVLDRGSYRIIPQSVTPDNNEEDDDADTIEPCQSGKDALIVQGGSIGSIVRVCADPRCAVHGSPLPDRAEQEERDRQREAEQLRQEEIRRERETMLDTIVQTAPETLTLDRWKLAFRILIDSASYSVLETLATYYEPDPDPNGRRAAKDVLQDIIQAADQQAMTAFVLRFTLLPQITDPDPDEIDLLKEAAAAFVPAKPSKTRRSKVQPISKTKSGRKRLAARGSK